MSEELSVREIRLQKLARMRELGHDPFAVEKFDRSGTATELKKRFDSASEEELKDQEITFAGRVVSYRDMGKAGFAHLSDGDDKIQVYVRKDQVGDVAWELYQLLDIGDHVGVRGYLFLTKTGERSIHVSELTPLTKCLEVLPLGKEKDGQQWYSLSDVEQRYRHRHLDLLTNHEARKALIDRAKMVSAVRRYFDGAGYLEVETPLLQVVAGGAAARPFTTFYNHYEMEVKLRISLELYLKRLICGDIPAVYEIGRVFRNEGVSNRHNPEFTLLEFYEAYTNLEGMMKRVEEMFAFVCESVYGTTVIQLGGKTLGEDLPVELTKWGGLHVRRYALTDSFAVTALTKPIADAHPFLQSVNLWLMGSDLLEVENDFDSDEFVLLAKSPFKCNANDEEQPAGVYRFSIHEPSSPVQGLTIDFSKPWRRVDLLDEIALLSGLDRSDLGDLEIAKAAILSKGVIDKAHELGSHIDLAKEDNLGGLLEKLLEVFVEPTLQEPTFVVGYPIETSPLAKKDPANARMTRRFEGYILGREMCNAFSEINDPVDQKERFEQQAQEIAKGDDEAHPYDQEFLYALECGMPPTGGCGIGMERLAMVLTGSDHIREIMFFPMMKPE